METALVLGFVILIITTLILDTWVGFLIARTRRTLEQIETTERTAEEDLAKIDALYLQARRVMEAWSDDHPN